MENKTQDLKKHFEVSYDIHNANVSTCNKNEAIFQLVRSGCFVLMSKMDDIFNIKFFADGVQVVEDEEILKKFC